MKNIINFVNKYKDIFTTDLPHMTSASKRKTVFDIVKLMAIITSLAVIIGYLTNTIENLSYVVYIIHTIFLGSFVIYIYIYEIKNQSKKRDLNPIIITMFSSFPLFSVILLSNGIFFATYFKDASLVFNVYLFIITGSILYLIILTLSSKKIIYEKRLPTNLIINIIATFGFYIGIIRFLPFININIAYITSTSILYTTFFVKTILTKYFGNVSKSILFKTFLILSLSIITFKVFMSTDPIMKESFLIHDFAISASSSFEDIEIYTVTITDDHYILRGEKSNGDDVYQVYDYDSNFVHEFIRDTDDYIYIFDNDFYIIEKVGNSENTTVDYTFKIFNKDFEVIKEDYLFDVEPGNFFPYGDNLYAFKRTGNATLENHLEVYSSFDQTSYILDSEDFESNEIIFKDKRTATFNLNGTLYFIEGYSYSFNYGGDFISDTNAKLFYNNDYILISENRKSTIVSFDDFYNNNHQNEIILNYSARNFDFDSDKFYIVGSYNSYSSYFVYNIYGDTEFTIDLDIYGYSFANLYYKLQYTNNNLIFEEDNILYFVDSDNINIMKIDQNISFHEKLGAALLATTSIILTNSAILIIRGDKYE